jgi:hypothetical protein
MKVNLLRALFAITASLIVHALIGDGNAAIGLVLFFVCWWVSGRIISKDLDKPDLDKHA